MAARSYQNLAISWVPDSQEKRSFYIITATVLFFAALLAVVLASVEPPPKERRAREAVPERVARFINQQKRPPVPPPVEAVPTPRPIPSPKPKVARQRDEEEKTVPLTESEKIAREKASESGLLALGSELADLIDTADVSEMVGTRLRGSATSGQNASGVSTDVLTAGVSQGSGGVATTDYTGSIGSTRLSQREVALVRQSLLKNEDATVSRDGPSVGASASGNTRSEEEVTIVFDQNKGQLFSIYNRERRKKPGLKGKIVLEITISPDGTVADVKVASSELNDPSLERRLVARVRQFRFEARDVESVTVTFPIEFLPS